MFEEKKSFGRRIPEELQVKPEFEQPLDGKQVKLVSTTSKYLFREINLFIPETIGLGIAAMMCIFGIAFGILLKSDILLIVGAIIPLAVFGLFYMLRLILFMPNKNRFTTLRLLGSNAIRFSVDTVKNREIVFDKNHQNEKIRLINLTKHTDYASGKPVLALREGAGENIDLNEGAKVSMQATDFSNILSSTWGTAEDYIRYNILKKEDKKSTLLIIILLAVGVAVCVVIWMMMQNGASLDSLVKSMSVPAKQIASNGIHDVNALVIG